MRPMMMGLALALALTGAAKAGEIADAAGQAETLASEGKFLEALDALTEAQAKLWDLSPMLVRKALFVAGEPGGFGIYQPRETSVFKKSETLLIYAEPVGYGYSKEGPLYVVDIGMDFVINDKSGAQIAAQQNFGTLNLKSNVPNREFFAKISYDFSGLQAGDYEVTTTLNDRASGESVSFALPLTMVE